MSALTLSTESPATRPHQTGLHVALVQLQRARTRAGRTRSARLSKARPLAQSEPTSTTRRPRLDATTCEHAFVTAGGLASHLLPPGDHASLNPERRSCAARARPASAGSQIKIRKSGSVRTFRWCGVGAPSTRGCRTSGRAPLPQPHRFSRAARSVTRGPCEPGRLTGRRSDGAGRRPARRLGTRDAAP